MGHCQSSCKALFPFLPFVVLYSLHINSSTSHVLFCWEWAVIDSGVISSHTSLFTSTQSFSSQLESSSLSLNFSWLAFLYRLPLMTEASENAASYDTPISKLPDHLLIEIFIRVPITDWAQISCVRKHWANLFRGEYLWQAALVKTYPFADLAKRWPGPIPRGLGKRRFTALYISRHIFAPEDEMDEIVGHAYLFLKEQLEISTVPAPSSILHGTIIDQFIACGKPRDRASELASQIWLAVIDNLEENEKTFVLLKRLAMEANVFLPYPYARSDKVQWRVFEKLFTDYRDCLNRVDYCDLLACAKSRFQPIPSTWLGY